ncbi:IS3 family transposase [Nocardia pseudovaccinii]|uniref:IS3 family transposase n=1 Tax=Nocardia pseudovaccinii TaxID=189540 RepID=UPI003D92EF98
MAPECACFDVNRMAELLGVSISGYYRFLQIRASPEVSARLQRRRDLEVKILAHHRASRGTYGSPRITADLQAEGERASKNTVAAIMADLGIEGISPRTFKTIDYLNQRAPLRYARQSSKVLVRPWAWRCFTAHRMK